MDAEMAVTYASHSVNCHDLAIAASERPTFQQQILTMSLPHGNFLESTWWQVDFPSFQDGT